MEKTKHEAPKTEKKKPVKKPKPHQPMVRITASAELEKRTISLSKTTWEILDGYLEFLSSFYGSKVTQEQVLESRIETLLKDRMWSDWKQKHAQSPAESETESST
jgi:hypothetical protein